MDALQLSSFEAVIFDLDSTLTDTHRYPSKAVMWVLSQCTEDVAALGDEYVETLVRSYFAQIVDIVNGAQYRSAFEIVRTAIKTAVDSVCLQADDEIILEGTKLFKRLHVEMSTPYPGSKELLERLSEFEVKIGVVTNSFGGNMSRILKEVGLLEYVDSIVDEDDVKSFKPMRPPFEEILRRLQVSPSETVFVGDEYFADIVGASRMNMSTVWVNSRDQNLEEQKERYATDIEPDLIVNSIKDLLDYL